MRVTAASLHVALVQRVAIGDGGLILMLGDVGVDRGDIQMDGRV